MTSQVATAPSKRSTSPGMDRALNKPSSTKTMAIIAGGLLLVILVVFKYLSPADLFTGRTLQIDQNRLNISLATQGIFEDYIPLRAKVAPLKTVYLDAVQGGRVEEVLVEDGAYVQAGQAILTLSNSDLQLSVMSTESRVMEQLNAMHAQELRLEQNRLAHKRTLVELNYQIRRLERDMKSKKELIAKAHISKSNYDNFVDELRYYRERRDISLESQESDEKLMTTQMKFFTEKTSSMEANLAFARKSLQALIVHAPVAGRLSGFDTEIGQNVPRGARIGQISEPDKFKLEANIDEYYLSRIALGQKARFIRDNKDYLLQVTKIYPNVNKGQFRIDLKMLGAEPSGLRRGQTLQSRLTLGDTNKALLIPNGQFFQDTGGRWLFVVNSEGNEARKRTVRLGRRNNKFIEVLEGLSPGESVVTSSYSNFKTMDTLTLD